MPKLGHLRQLYRWWTQTEVLVLQHCGVEATFFVRFTRFLFVLSAIATLTLFPSIASFTHYVGRSQGQTDLLNSMSWSNLSTTDSKVYWLYCVLVPATVSATLYAISRQLCTSMEIFKLCVGQQGVRDDGAKRVSRFFVAVQGRSTQGSLQHVLDYFSRWKHYICDAVCLAPSHPSPQRVDALVTQIEREEASFLYTMTRTARGMDRTAFPRYLAKRVAERYLSTRRPKQLLWSTNMPALYESLQKMVQAVEGTSQQAIDHRP